MQKQTSKKFALAPNALRPSGVNVSTLKVEDVTTAPYPTAVLKIGEQFDYDGSTYKCVGYVHRKQQCTLFVLSSNDDNNSLLVSVSKQIKLALGVELQKRNTAKRGVIKARPARCTALGKLGAQVRAYEHDFVICRAQAITHLRQAVEELAVNGTQLNSNYGIVGDEDVIAQLRDDARAFELKLKGAFVSIFDPKAAEKYLIETYNATRRGAAHQKTRKRELEAQIASLEATPKAMEKVGLPLTEAQIDAIKTRINTLKTELQAL